MSTDCNNFYPTDDYPVNALHIHKSEELSLLINGKNKEDIASHHDDEGSEKSYGSANEKCETQTDSEMFGKQPKRTTGKGARAEGVRNLQDSTFSLSGGDAGDTDRRSCIRVYNPPGGTSTGFW